MCVCGGQSAAQGALFIGMINTHTHTHTNTHTHSGSGLTLAAGQSVGLVGAQGSGYSPCKVHQS